MYCEQVKDAVLTGCEFMTMVRRQDAQTGPLSGRARWPAFDLVADPDEVVNLWNDPAAAAEKSDCWPNFANGGFAVACRPKTGAAIGVNNRCSKTYDVVSSRLPAGDPVTDRIRQARIGFGRRTGSDSAGTDRIRQARHNPSHRLIDSRCQRPRSLSSPLKIEPIAVIDRKLFIKHL